METITKERLDMLLDATANLFVEKAKQKELQGNASECVEQTISELMLNTELKVLFEEALKLASLWDEVVSKVMEIVHNENVTHDCNNCVLEYLCKPTESQKARIGILSEIAATIESEKK